MPRRVSPLPEITKRRPGQSLEARQNRILAGQWALLVFVALCLGLMIGNFWLPRTPFVGSVLLALIIAMTFAAVIIDRRFEKVWHAVTLGLQGEQHVGQRLQELEGHGARVLHDVIGPIGNIDHVVIHPSGIYAIETKTWSRVEKTFTHLSFDGRKIRRNGRPVKSDPAGQSIRAATWLRNYLKGDLGLNFRFPVKAVVVFPGWQVVVEREHPNVKVVSLGALVELIRTNTARHLSPAQVSFFANRIEETKRQ